MTAAVSGGGGVAAAGAQRSGFLPRGASNTKSPSDSGHDGNMCFSATSLYNEEVLSAQRSKQLDAWYPHHQAQLMFGVLPATAGGIRVGQCGLCN